MNVKKVQVKIELMGKCEIQVNNRLVKLKNIGLPIPWQVFLIMTTEENKWTPNDVFLKAFWADKPYDKAINSLKNAIRLLRSELCGESDEGENTCIEYCNGGYRLGPDIDIQADYMDFYESYKQIGERRAISIQAQLPIYCRMVMQYNGGLYHLEDKKDWMYQYAKILERIYSDSICDCFRMLSATGMYQEIVAIYDDVIKKHTPGTEMTGYWYRALEMLDSRADIPTYYAAAPERLRRLSNQNILLSEANNFETLIEEPYTETNKAQLLAIKEELIVVKKRKARIMDYEKLKKYCAKNTSRLSLGLFTFAIEHDMQNDFIGLENAVEVFKNIALTTLRREDILTPYSENQILIVLPNHSISSGILVRERLCRLFMQRERSVKITADVIGV